MKNTFFILLALFVATPAAATDDEKPTDAPTAVEVLDVETLPISAEVPKELAHKVVSEEEPVQCWRDNEMKHLQLMQYGLVVGIAFDAGPYGSFLGMAYVLGNYTRCKIKKRRANRGAEQH